MADPSLAVRTPTRWAERLRNSLGVIAVIVVVVIWEIYGELFLKTSILFSYPSAIWSATVKMAQDGTLWTHINASFYVFVYGYVLAAVVGIPLGILAGWYKLLDIITKPFVNGLYTTPRVALIPLIIMWFGLGTSSKVVVVFLSAVFPIMLNAQGAMATLDPELLRTARSFMANDWKIFFTIALPASVPALITGLRLGIGRALVGVVVAEMYSANAGVGFLISVAGNTFQTGKLFVGILLIASFGILTNSFLQMLEKRLDTWRPAH